MHNFRHHFPQAVLAFLPLTLFFPVGFMYGGLALLLIAVICSGDFRAKWQRVRTHVLALPVAALSAVSIFAAIFLERPTQEFWSGFYHYQTYLYLLLFISLGAGNWQRRAVLVFYAGAIVATTIFYLHWLQILPEQKLFVSYRIYSGNKSILLGILLGLAAGWMLYDSVEQKKHRLLRILALAYVLSALLFFAKTRTGNLIFIMCAFLVVCRQLYAMRFTWRSALVLLGMCAVLIVVWESADTLRQRLVGMVQDVQSFSRTGKTSEDGIRLEMYKITAQMVAEKPVLGHGVGTWLDEYQSRAKGMATQHMTTPHNDYLLYASELGLIGLAALLWIWIKQLLVAWNLTPQHHGMRLAMLTLAMMLGGMFNAILRDAVFGIAFMILLAIPLAGVQRTNGKA